MPRRAAPLLALALLFVAACAHRPSPAGERGHDTLQQREHSFLAALGARDLERTTAFFAEDAVLHVADMPPLQGREAIARFYGNVFRFMRASEATPERLRVSSSDDLAYGMGRVRNVFAAEGEPLEYEGKYLLVWEKRAGDWTIVLYGISNDRAETSR